MRRERVLQREPRAERLEPQMILLVHHDAQAVAEEHRRAAPHRMLRLEPRQLLAHEMPLVQQRPVVGGSSSTPDEDAVRAGAAPAPTRLAHLREDAQPLAVARPRR